MMNVVYNRPVRGLSSVISALAVSVSFTSFHGRATLGFLRFSVLSIINIFLIVTYFVYKRHLYSELSKLVLTY